MIANNDNFVFKPFKKESLASSGGNGAFGRTLMNSFGVKNLINRRKKSAPEQETKKIIVNTEPDEDYEAPEADYSSIIYSNRISAQLAATAASSATHIYYIYLTDSCCVEVSSTQPNSTVQNLLLQVFKWFIHNNL